MRKIFNIVGNNDLCISAYGGCKYMAIFLVVGHRGNQLLISLHPCVGKMPPDLTLPVSRLLGTEAEVFLQIVIDFSHDLVGPFWQVELRPRSEAQECIRQWHWNQNAGIKNNRRIRRHSSWPPSGNLFFSYSPVSKA